MRGLADRRPDSARRSSRSGVDGGWGLDAPHAVEEHPQRDERHAEPDGVAGLQVDSLGSAKTIRRCAMPSSSSDHRHTSPAWCSRCSFWL
jgi:hypothetical protein